MNRATAFRIVACIAGLGGAVVRPLAGADEPSAAGLDRMLALEQAVVTTTGGRTYRGHLDGWREGRMYLRFATDGGEVGYSFAPSDVVRLDLPGAEIEALALEMYERGEVADAHPLLAAIARQRFRYLPVLQPGQRRALFAFVEASDAVGDPYATIGYASQLLPHATLQEDRTLLTEANLSAYLKLGLREEARRIAREWCAAADPSGRSVLGWAILARLAYEEGDHERALWIALQPVVFAGHRPPRHLDACYAWAVCAAHQLGLTEKAAGLFREMQARELRWPEGPEEVVFIGTLYKGDRDPATASAARKPPDLAAAVLRGQSRASSREAGGSTLEEVCRLLRSPGP